MMMWKLVQLPVDFSLLPDAHVMVMMVMLVVVVMVMILTKVGATTSGVFLVAYVLAMEMVGPQYRWL